MSRIVFEKERPVAQVDPGRADVACFVGLVRCTGAAIPSAVQDWLQAQGWVDGPFSRPLSPILDFPIPIETYPTFTTLFDAGGSGASFGTDYLAAAVRTFFAQGGKLCYVIRMDDPVTPLDNLAAKKAKLDKLLPSTTYAIDDQSNWHGVGHLAGLPEVSFLVMPDLPVLTSSAQLGAAGQMPTPATGPEQFVECTTLPTGPGAISGISLAPNPVNGGQISTATVTLALPAGSAGVVVNLSSTDSTVTLPPYVTVPPGESSVTFTVSTQVVDTQKVALITASSAVNSVFDLLTLDPPTTALTSGPPAPRHTPSDYACWADAVQTVLQYLSNGSLREMLLVAGFPMPLDSGIASSAANPATSLTQDIHDVILARMKEQTGLNGSISSAFLQLGYPWLKTTSSAVLLEGIEPPDGALTGLLARNALTRGTFTSATKVTPSEVYDVSPILPSQETKVSATPLTWGDNSWKPLIERISLFGPTPVGIALLSDVTAYPGESYRPGRIHRLVAVILRAARHLGEDIVFQNNGPALWARVQTFLMNLMMRLWQLNALDGDTIQDAFSVRCDNSTMTQNDLDNGRLVAVVSFNAASTIELIRVTLALQTSGTSAQSIAALAEAS